MHKYTTSSLSMWPNQSAGQGFFSSIAIAISLMKCEDKGKKNDLQDLRLISLTTALCGS